MADSVYFPHMGTVKEASEASGLAKGHIRRLIATGTVRSVRAGHRILVNLDSLSKYLEVGDAPQTESASALPGIHRISQ